MDDDDNTTSQYSCQLQVLGKHNYYRLSVRKRDGISEPLGETMSGPAQGRELEEAQRVKLLVSLAK